MATQNPTGDGSGINLSVADCDRPFLRRIVLAASDGLREDLDRFADQLREPAGRLLREEASYGALLDGLDGEIVYPDDALIATLARLAWAIDRDNDYLRVVAEHLALGRLLAQLREVVS